MKRCVILAARPVSVQMREYFRDGDFIIAADDGYDNARRLCVTPDLCIGDFDSSDVPTADVKVIRLPREKDDTDTYSAAKEAVKRGYTEVIILGGLGGRVDHSIANMQTLVYLEKQGVHATLADEYNEITVLLQGTREIASRMDCYLSIYPIGAEAKGVSMQHVRYELEDAVLTNDFPLGTSNEFRFSPALITVKTGGLFIVLSSKE